MKYFVVAKLESRHFIFDAFGASEIAARAALEAGLIHHAEMTGIARDWFKGHDITYREVRLGGAYRDGEPVPVIADATGRRAEAIRLMSRMKGATIDEIVETLNIGRDDARRLVDEIGKAADPSITHAYVTRGRVFYARASA